VISGKKPRLRGSADAASLIDACPCICTDSSNHTIESAGIKLRLSMRRRGRRVHFVRLREKGRVRRNGVEINREN